MENKNNWIALAIGNSRLHWGYFQENSLIETWDTQHLSIAVAPDRLPTKFTGINSIKNLPLQLPIYIASVVREQTKLWQNYTQLNLIKLKDIKLANIYPTLGIDRALAVWGAVEIYDKDCLVIDGGTALTFTGVSKEKKLIGGAILPGLRSQLITLNQKTSALSTVNLPNTLPVRWALSTNDAIASGIVYSTIAGIYSYINDWLKLFPHSKVIFTGGDGELLSKYFQVQYSQAAIQTIIDHNLVFYGIKSIRFDRAK